MTSNHALTHQQKYDSYSYYLKSLTCGDLSLDDSVKLFYFDSVSTLISIF